jgi:aminopeptidase C
MVRIWDFMEKQDKMTTLPPILPLAIYHGKARWRVSRDFLGVIAAPEALKPYLPAFTYLLTAFSRFSHEEI